MALSTLATYNVPAHHPFRLIIAKGSVTDFSYPSNPQRSAIVNSTNEVGLRGGRVDGAVSDAGGPKLKVDRQNLPVKYSKRLLKNVRCPEGKAVMTGPNSYGKLRVPYVIHAFGGFSTQSLSSAYSSCLEHGKKSSLEAIAFSLLMAGFYLGSEIMIHEVLKIGVNVIRRYEGYADLKAIYMCAYSETEAKQLVKVANEVFATSLPVGKNLPISFFYLGNESKLKHIIVFCASHANRKRVNSLNYEKVKDTGASHYVQQKKAGRYHTLTSGGA